MFSTTLRRAIARATAKATSTTTTTSTSTTTTTTRQYLSKTNTTTTTTRRRFGGAAHHDDHHHGPTYMSTKSELPPGDWRNKPMHWDFNRKPTSEYEAFVARNLSGPDDPALKLTKGQFIVHMRRLEREELGSRMFWGRVHGMGAALAAVVFTNAYFKPFDVVNLSKQEIDYQTIFEIARINGPNYANPTSFRYRLDEFFKEHNEETVAKLPKELQEVYFKHKDEYNEQYSTLPPLIQPNENLLPAALQSQREALMKQYNLTQKEIDHVIRSCDPTTLMKQVFDVEDGAKLPAEAQVAIQFAQLQAQQQ